MTNLLRWCYRLIVIVLMIYVLPAYADSIPPDGEQPPSRITTLDIVTAVSEHYMEYTHYQWIGLCFWLECDGPICHPRITNELDMYLPDLVISVFNGYGGNPWWEVNEFLDEPAHLMGDQAMQAYANGLPLENGNSNSQASLTQYDGMRMRSVDVIGNPIVSLIDTIPIPILSPETKPYQPYYQSDLDAIGDRTGFAETLQMAKSINPFKYYIGNSVTNHWSYEFPRSMSINVPNNYKASVIAALHAADIVTNKNTGHVVSSTNNTCGKNCAIANVIEENKESHAIWQEIYPNNRHIHPGESDATTTKSLGESDDQAGNGNYVFVLWRHYRGCVQHPGTYLGATQSIPPTKKR